jgi:hypothetical protein
MIFNLAMTNTHYAGICEKVSYYFDMRVEVAMVVSVVFDAPLTTAYRVLYGTE